MSTPTAPAPGRTLAAMLAAVGSAGCVLISVRWHSPENFFEFNAPSIPWSYLWSVALLAVVLFATTAWLVRSGLGATAWFGAALLGLSALGLVEAFWFAIQVLQGSAASRVLTYARGYAVTFAVGLVLLWAATALLRRRGRPAQEATGAADADTADPDAAGPSDVAERLAE
jgi:hypothetical protein